MAPRGAFLMVGRFLGDLNIRDRNGISIVVLPPPSSGTRCCGRGETFKTRRFGGFHIEKPVNVTGLRGFGPGCLHRVCRVDPLRHIDRLCLMFLITP